MHLHGFLHRVIKLKLSPIVAQLDPTGQVYTTRILTITGRDDSKMEFHLFAGADGSLKLECEQQQPAQPAQSVAAPTVAEPATTTDTF